MLDEETKDGGENTSADQAPKEEGAAEAPEHETPPAEGGDKPAEDGGEKPAEG